MLYSESIIGTWRETVESRSNLSLGSGKSSRGPVHLEIYDKETKEHLDNTQYDFRKT